MVGSLLGSVGDGMDRSREDFLHDRIQSFRYSELSVYMHQVQMTRATRRANISVRITTVQMTHPSLVLSSLLS